MAFVKFEICKFNYVFGSGSIKKLKFKDPKGPVFVTSQACTVCPKNSGTVNL